MADASVVNLNSNFMCLGRGNLDIFNGEILAGLPRNRSLRFVLVLVRECQTGRVAVTLQVMVCERSLA